MKAFVVCCHREKPLRRRGDLEIMRLLRFTRNDRT
jgi:hypothetical protein